jgi:hypothetical protein
VNRNTTAGAVTPASERWTPRGAQLTLAGVILLTACVPAYFVWTWKGVNGLVALFLAALVCWSGAALALAVSGVLRGPSRALAVTLLGMALRVGLPLVAVIVVAMQNGPLAEGGFVVYVLFFYLVTLVVETWLSLKLMPPRERLEAR